MTNTEVGNNVFVEDLEKLANILDEYENNILSPIDDANNDEIDTYTKMPLELLGKMDSEECSAIAYKLSCYSMSIQRIYNRENGRVKWCDAVINSICARHWNDYDQYVKTEIKIELIAKENQAMQTVKKIKNHAVQRKERLYMMASSVKFISDCLIENARSKRKNES